MISLSSNSDYGSVIINTPYTTLEKPSLIYGCMQYKVKIIVEKLRSIGRNNLAKVLTKSIKFFKRRDFLS